MLLYLDPYSYNLSWVLLSTSMATPKLDAVKEVDIDESGRFKYILLKVHSEESGNEVSKFIARGFKWAEYHGDIYDDVEENLRKKGLDTECVGGGRIIHDPEGKTIKVFGYSQGFGRADHAKTCELIKKHYPGYTVTWSNEGY